MLRQGTNRLNQGHGSDGSGLVCAWGRLGLRLSQRYSGWDAEALVTAAELDSGDGSNDSRWETQGYVGRWKCEVAIWLTLPCLYRRCTATEESSLPVFAKLSEFGLLAFLHSKNFKIKLIILNNNKYITKNYC